MLKRLKRSVINRPTINLSVVLSTVLLTNASTVFANEATEDQHTPLLSENTQLTVYKTESCGCCNDWIKHMENHGFEVTAHNRNDLSAIKQAAGLTPKLASCHTAFVGGYVIEGHVPAQDVIELLKQQPDMKGLTVPGMPAGANVPGMEVSDDNATFDVLGFRANGTVRRWNHYE
ncbi:DUF411 domain-containing protein [Oleiphilus messinensis]|nr:DUF411 domain-containing protein [Oleiphilus messinensis]